MSHFRLRKAANYLDQKPSLAAGIHNSDEGKGEGKGEEKRVWGRGGKCLRFPQPLKHIIGFLRFFK